MRGPTIGMRTFQARLLPLLTVGRSHVTMAAKMDFPLSDRWKPNLVQSTANAKVKVLEKDKYPEWLAAQPAEVQAWMGMAGLSEFKDGGLTLMPNGDDAGASCTATGAKTATISTARPKALSLPAVGASKCL